jgi:pimeloyl-ACP methyl ester carboxylesterase
VTGRRSTVTRLIRLSLLALVLVVAAALTGGLAYETAGRRRDRTRVPRIGEAIDIGGRRLNLFCSGTGAPTVILIPDASQPGFSWSHIQPELARRTRACWFDRAGEGWSDPGPYPRTSSATAADLRAALSKAAVPPPYVLVGHSLGGLDARVFHYLYPGEVAGMVLADAAHEEEPRRAPASMLGRTAPRWLWRSLHLGFSAAARFGLIRLLQPEEGRAGPAEGREEILAALIRQPVAIASVASGGVVGPGSYEEAESAGKLGDLPLIVLTRGKPLGSEPGEEVPPDRLRYEQVWIHEIQPRLARLSTRGRQVILKNSGHRIPDDAPQAIVEAVQSIMAELRVALRVQ